MTATDATLVQIVDAALADAAQRSGRWLACRPGCTECCMGPFAITPLDARRLQQGLAGLEASDPERAQRVRRRARSYIERHGAEFPGDPATGLLAEGALDESDFAEDEPCPALDPDTGLCDLYAARPITCRTFGPPVRFGSESLALCELCFAGASEEEIAGCEVEIDPEGLEAALLQGLPPGETIVAYALTAPCPTTTK